MSVPSRHDTVRSPPVGWRPRPPVRPPSMVESREDSDDVAGFDAVERVSEVHDVARYETRVLNDQGTRAISSPTLSTSPYHTKMHSTIHLTVQYNTHLPTCTVRTRFILKLRQSCPSSRLGHAGWTSTSAGNSKICPLLVKITFLMCFFLHSKRSELPSFDWSKPDALKWWPVHIKCTRTCSLTRSACCEETSLEVGVLAATLGQSFSFCHPKQVKVFLFQTKIYPNTSL